MGSAEDDSIQVRDHDYGLVRTGHAEVKRVIVTGYQRLPCTLRQKIQSLMLRSVGGKRVGFFIRFGIAQKS